MTAFAFVYYDPKPPSKTSIRKSSSKFNKNLATESSSVPVEALPALGRASDDNDWCQQAVGDSVATVQGTQVSKSKVGTQASMTERGGFDNDIDTEFLPLTRLLSSNDKLESAEERPAVESTVGQGDNQGPDDILLGSRVSRPGSIYNEPVISHRDDKSEDNNNFDSGRGRYIMEGGQPGYDTFDMDHPPMFSTRPTYEDGGIGIDKSMSHQTMKRQRSSSPLSTFASLDSIASLLPRNEDEEGSRELASHPGKARADDICSKRRKVSTPQGRWTVPRSDPLQPSPLVSDDDEDSEEDDGTFSISLDPKLANSTRSTSASGVTSPAELQVCPVVTDIDPDWDVREIIGKEDLDGVSYYLVDWHPTLLPADSLGHAKELVDKFEARIRAQRGIKRGGIGLNTGQKAGVKATGKKARGHIFGSQVSQ